MFNNPYVKYLISCEVYKIRKLHKRKLEDSIVTETSVNESSITKILTNIQIQK